MCDFDGEVGDGLAWATDDMKEVELCNEGAQNFLPKCKLWTDLSPQHRIDFLPQNTATKTVITDTPIYHFTINYNNAEANGDLQSFLQAYNSGLASQNVTTTVSATTIYNGPAPVQVGSYSACDLGNYILNSVNWPDSGPMCINTMPEEKGGIFAAISSYPYYVKDDTRHFLKPTSRDICEWMGAEWVLYGNVPQSYNNVLAGLMSWVELSTTEGWVDAMYAAVKFRGEDMEPMDVDLYAADQSDFFSRYVASTLLFVFFIVFGTFLLTNLFVGTVCNVFEDMRKANNGQAVFMTDAQQEWQDRQRTVMGLQPFLKPRAPENACRNGAFSFSLSEGFESFIFACIAINTLIMLVRFFPTMVPPHWQLGLASEILNIIFAVIFTIEAIVKIVGLGQQYFCKKSCRSKKKDKDGNTRNKYTCSYVDAWNLFDFIIVVGTLFGLVIKYGVGFSGINAITTIIRTFRVARIFRLAKHRYLKKLKTLIQLIWFSLPSIINLGLVLLLFLAIFSVLGVQLFATVAHNDALNDHANFQSFPVALLTLFRGTTGENWNGIMHAVSRSQDDCNADMQFDPNMCGYCEWNQILYVDGGDPLACMNLPASFANGTACSAELLSQGLCDFPGGKCKPINGCGQRVYSETYFIVYTLVLTYMIMNIVIAVILEAYSRADLEEKAIVRQDDFRVFTAKWAELDPDGTMTIPFAMLQQFIKDLPYPMGFKADLNQKNTEEINKEAESFVDAKVCVMSAPTIENDEDNEHEKEIKNQREKRLQEISKIVNQPSGLQLNQEIDKMTIRPYEENGDAIVRFRDVLFAVVQRSYKEISTLKKLAKTQIDGQSVDDEDDDDEADAFSINEDHQSLIDAETKGKAVVPIKMSHYSAALAIAQAYRAHTFRNIFLAKSGLSDTKEEHLSETVDTQVDSA